jgi:hypothetical protein
MKLPKVLPEVNYERMKQQNLTNTEIACYLLGWQGGTVHQVAEITGLSVKEIIDSKDIKKLLESEEEV